MKPNMKFTMNRDVNVTSRFGHSIAFKKGKATLVPSEMAHEVLAMGGVPDSVDKIAFDDQQTRVHYEPSSEVERQARISEALEAIETRAKREEFAANGAPKTKTVSEMLGFEVSSKEVTELWMQRNRSRNA